MRKGFHPRKAAPKSVRFGHPVEPALKSLPQNVPVWGFLFRDSVGSHLARIARYLNPIEATGMRLEVRRSRSSRSSNLFPLASYIFSDQEPGRTASELRTALLPLFQGRVHALGKYEGRFFALFQLLRDPRPQPRDPVCLGRGEIT